MVDLDSHRIIDLIPTRNTEEVKNWPAEYPNIEVISRDVAPIYASAAKKSHPEVIQVSDRFHIIKGLTDAVTRYLIREFPARIEIPAGSVNSDEIKRLQNINNRSEIVDRIIVKEMHHIYKTIQNYLSPEYSIEDRHYNMRIPGKLSPYESEVIKLRSEGMTYPAIYKIITEKGYDGSVASLRMFM